MGRKRAASPTRIAVQSALKKIEWSGDDANGPLSKICHLPKKQVSAILQPPKAGLVFDILQRRGGRRSNKEGVAQLKRASNVEAHSKHRHQSVVRPSASNTRVLRGTARCNACLKTGRCCSCMHPEAAIQECLFLIEIPHNAHEVYMTAVENFSNMRALQARHTRRPLSDKELAEYRKAFQHNQIGKLIVDMYGDADSLVWNTLNEVFRISQDPRVSCCTTSSCSMLDIYRLIPKRKKSINKCFAYGFWLMLPLY
jgi:hypothetical protein